MPSDRASILLVESHEDSRSMYAGYLGLQDGLTCVLADSSDDGLVRAVDADAIVTGIRVIGSFDGIELVRRLRADPRTRDKPVIVLTACAGQADRERAEAAGCDMFLAKPCLPRDLVRALRRLMARHQVQQLRATPGPATPARRRRTAHRTA